MASVRHASAQHTRDGENARNVSRALRPPRTRFRLLEKRQNNQACSSGKRSVKWEMVKNEKKWSKNNEKKNAFYVSVNVFNTNVLTGDTTLTSPTMSLLESGSPFMWSPEPCEGLASCNAKGILSFLSYFKTLSFASALGIKPATSPLCSQELFRLS